MGIRCVYAVASGKQVERTDLITRIVSKNGLRVSGGLLGWSMWWNLDLRFLITGTGHYFFCVMPELLREEQTQANHANEGYSTYQQLQFCSTEESRTIDESCILIRYYDDTYHIRVKILRYRCNYCTVSQRRGQFTQLAL